MATDESSRLESSLMDLSLYEEESSRSNSQGSSDGRLRGPGGGRGRSRGQSRGQGQGRGCARGRGQGRGRGRGRGPWERVSQEDAVRINALQATRTQEMKTKVAALRPAQKDQLLHLVMLQLPGVMFDIMDFCDPDPNPGPPNPGQPSWCVCTNCREMPSDIERKCCRQRPENCISRSAQMNLYVLDEGILRLARGAWNDIFALDDKEAGNDNRENRHTAYRHFVLWQHGRLGEGNRVVIPSCVVWRVRETYPDAHSHYTGFIPRRLLE